MPVRVTVFPIGSKWPGELVEEGPEQSIVMVLDGPLKGQRHCFMNKDFLKVKERKSSGLMQPSDYPLGAGARTRRKPMEEEKSPVETTEADKVDYRAQYNELVEEAVSIGLTAKKVKVNFRDEETGARRCEALAEAIEAQRAKIASGEVEAAPPPEARAEEPAPPKANQETKKMAKSSTAKKAAPKKAVAKKAAKAAPKKAVAKEVRTGIAGEFETREGTKKEQLLLFLNSNKNKAVSVKSVLKQIYGKTDTENLVALKGVILGLQVAIEEKKLKYEVLYEGRGEDATLKLSTK